MYFRDLLTSTPILASGGNLKSSISGITSDSRSVKPGFVFVCRQGTHHDGHAFIGEALRRGAAALVTGKAIPSPHIPWAQVEDPGKHMATMAAVFHGHPSTKMRLIGITGTNGKTTTSYLVQAIYEEAGYPAAVMGTAGLTYQNYYREMDKTTPEAPLIQEMLASLVKRGAEAVAMEVSSHALAQQRVDACRFHGAVFTNLTRDHLDYHGSMEEYLRAKSSLFEARAGHKPGFAVLNADDSSYDTLRSNTSLPVISYGIKNSADVRVQGKILQRTWGQDFCLKTYDGTTLVHLNLPETFNVYNALAAAAVGVAEGFSLDTIKKGLEKVRKVTGRLEPLALPLPFAVIVDFAHTPDALEKVLSYLKKQEHRRLLVVFGCPGERDKGKRPMMGRIASEYCDLVVLTADNPVRENVLSIIDDIRAGVEGECVCIPDRQEAVQYALSRAQAGDILLLAGKGHETYQLINGDKIPYSDRLAVKRALAASQQHQANPTSPPPGSGGLQKPLPSTYGDAYDKFVPKRYGPPGPSPGSLP
jgi:UDP-N-acetylmuramoyl-L-alanyl-D-glutamate--2,6-diaminopimelate ligase